MKLFSVVPCSVLGAVLLLAIAACAPPPAPPSPPPVEVAVPAPVPAPAPPPVVEKKPAPPLPRVKGDLSIAGGEVRNDYPVEILFPNLFLPFAALPVPEEIPSLTGIARLITANPEIPWILECAAKDPESEAYALRLARERGTLILRYLGRQGVPAERIALQPVVGEVPLTLKQGGPR